MIDARIDKFETNLRLQQKALLELIEIALLAVRESGDSSVTAMHLNTRLLDLEKQIAGSSNDVHLPNVGSLPGANARPV